jgi:hypothetical protein
MGVPHTNRQRAHAVWRALAAQMEGARPPPPFKMTYSAQNARTKARPLTVSDSGAIIDGKVARNLSEVEWRCVLLTWAVTGWTCRCSVERLQRFECNCGASWAADEPRHIATSKDSPRNLWAFWTGETAATQPKSREASALQAMDAGLACWSARCLRRMEPSIAQLDSQNRP